MADLEQPDGPRLCRADEYDEVMAFTDRVFRPGQRGRFIVQNQYPHAYQKRWAKRIVVLRERGKLVGDLAIHPLQIRVEGVPIKVGGIGIVGTDPKQRGRGIMSTLLKDAIGRMYRSGCALSVLSGDRQRYGWFGWENGGVHNVFTLGPRFLGRPSVAERKLVLERFEPTPALCRRIRAWGQQHDNWIERSVGDIAPLLERNGRHAWVCRDGQRFAYVVLGGPNRKPRPYERVDEAGGDEALVASMLRLLMARYRLQKLRAVAGPNPRQVALFEPYSGSWTRACDGMLRVVNLPLLLEGLAPLLQQRARAAKVGGRYHFVIADLAQEGRLDLGRGPHLRLALSAQELVRLFFGLLPVPQGLPALGQGAGGLERILPLPFFYPALNHV